MTRLPKLRSWHALACAVFLVASACGSSSTTAGGTTTTTAAGGATTAGGSATTAAGGSAPKGDPIKVGVLHSLSGTMSISEVAVHDAELLAIQEVNDAGGVLGRPLVPVVEDGASDWPTFASKAEKLLTVDKVAVVFGGWTSASRKAMLPVFEGLDGLLFYPVQYEGLEASPNIFYTGATTNQQIVPALDYIKEQGMKNVYLVGSDYVFPRTANKIIKAYAAANGLNVVGEDYLPLGATDTATIVSKVLAAKPDIVFNTLNGDSNVAFFKELTAKGNTPDKIQTLSVSIAEEETNGIGIDNIKGNLVAWNYYQTTANPKNKTFVDAFKAKYGANRVTDDPIEAGYVGVHLWAAAANKAGSTDVAAVKKAAKGLTYDAPEGNVTVSDWNQHIFKTARIGKVNANGLIDEVWSSDKPIEPDPCLFNYTWATGLAQGECDAAKAAGG